MCFVRTDCGGDFNNMLIITVQLDATWTSPAATFTMAKISAESLSSVADAGSSSWAFSRTGIIPHMSVSGVHVLPISHGSVSSTSVPAGSSLSGPVQRVASISLRADRSRASRVSRPHHAGRLAPLPFKSLSSKYDTRAASSFSGSTGRFLSHECARKLSTEPTWGLPPPASLPSGPALLMCLGARLRSRSVRTACEARVLDCRWVLVPRTVRCTRL